MDRRRQLRPTVACLVPVQGTLDLDAPIPAPMDTGSQEVWTLESAPDQEPLRAGVDRRQLVHVSEIVPVL